MTFWTVCDWCGATLADQPRAVLKVTIIGRPRRIIDPDEVRPTLHLCVEPTPLSGDDLDRMGLGDDTADGGCYAKALAFINGRETEPPDMGMEWRLVPTGAPHTDRSGGLGVADDRGARLYDDRHKPGGIYELCKRDIRVEIPPRAWRAILTTEIVTVDQLEAVPDEQLLPLDGVGVASIARIREAIAAYRHRSPASAHTGRMES